MPLNVNSFESLKDSMHTSVQMMLGFILLEWILHISQIFLSNPIMGNLNLQLNIHSYKGFYMNVIQYVHLVEEVWFL